MASSCRVASCPLSINLLCALLATVACRAAGVSVFAVIWNGLSNEIIAAETINIVVVVVEERRLEMAVDISTEASSDNADSQVQDLRSRDSGKAFTEDGRYRRCRPADCQHMSPFYMSACQRLRCRQNPAATDNFDDRIIQQLRHSSAYKDNRPEPEAPVRPAMGLHNGRHSARATDGRRCGIGEKCTRLFPSALGPSHFWCVGRQCRRRPASGHLSKRHLVSEDRQSSRLPPLLGSRLTSNPPPTSSIEQSNDNRQTYETAKVKLNDVIDDRDQELGVKTGVTNVLSGRVVTLASKRGGFVDMSGTCMTFNCARFRPGTFGYLQCVSHNRCA